MTVVDTHEQNLLDSVALVERVQGGDHQATDRLINQCLPRLRAYAANRGSSDPDGVGNLVMSELLRKLPSLHFQTEAHLWSYAYSIVRSRLADEQRQRERDLTGGASLSADASAGTDFGFDETVVERVWLRSMLSRLTNDQRSVLELRFFEDLSIADTAKRTGKSTTAVKGLQRRALNALLATLTLVLVAVVFNVVVLDDGGHTVKNMAAEETPPPDTGGPQQGTSATADDSGSPDQSDQLPTTTIAPGADSPVSTDATAAPVESPTTSSTTAPEVVMDGGSEEASTASNPPPVAEELTLDAGPDQSISLPASANLVLTASGQPSSVVWSVVTGPAGVVFADADQGVDAHFTTPGTYVLKVAAEFTSGRRLTDILTVVVEPGANDEEVVPPQSPDLSSSAPGPAENGPPVVSLMAPADGSSVPRSDYTESTCEAVDPTTGEPLDCTIAIVEGAITEEGQIMTIIATATNASGELAAIESTFTVLEVADSDAGDDGADGADGTDGEE